MSEIGSTCNTPISNWKLSEKCSKLSESDLISCTYATRLRNLSHANHLATWHGFPIFTTDVFPVYFNVLSKSVNFLNYLSKQNLYPLTKSEPRKIVTKFSSFFLFLLYFCFILFNSSNFILVFFLFSSSWIYFFLINLLIYIFFINQVPTLLFHTIILTYSCNRILFYRNKVSVKNLKKKLIKLQKYY